MVSGPDAEMAFDAGGWSWSVTAELEHEGNRYEHGSVTACALAGDSCYPYASNCCDGLSCNSDTMTCN